MLAAACLTVTCGAAGCAQTSSFKAGLSPAKSISITASSPASPATATTAPSVPASTTSAPASSQPPSSATAQPGSPAPTARPGSGSPAPVSSSAASLLWLWVAIAVLAAVALIALIARAARRRSARARQWRSNVVDAYAKGAALHDAINVAGLPLLQAGEAAGARWADIQRRADDLTQVLYQLREAAPGDEERAHVADVLAALQAVRSALEAGRLTASSDMDPEVVRSRLQYFEATLRALRDPMNSGRY